MSWGKTRSQVGEDDDVSLWSFKNLIIKGMGPNLCYKPLLLAPWFVTGKEMHPLLKQKTFLLLLPWKLRKIRPSSKASLAKLASQIILSHTEELGFQWRFPPNSCCYTNFSIRFFFFADFLIYNCHWRWVKKIIFMNQSYWHIKYHHGPW